MSSVIVEVELLAMKFADDVVGVDFLLREIVEHVLLCQLAAHEDGEPVQVVTFFAFQLTGAEYRPYPATQAQSETR